jgi:hypothetical protein
LEVWQDNWRNCAVAVLVVSAIAEEPKHFGKLKREVQGILPFGRDVLDYKGNDSKPSYSS